MPIYEYECKKCKEVFEMLQTRSDDSPTKCELCGSKRIGRIMSRTSFILKGEGWYVTDYARKEQKQKEKQKDSADSPQASDKSKGDKSKESSEKSGKADAKPKKKAKTKAS